MKKKLLVAAVAAVMVAPLAANADPKVYGKFHVSIDRWDGDVSGDAFYVKSRASRLGVKGSEDLGGGLAVTYQAEFQVDIDDNGGDNGPLWTARNQFVGLKGGFGEVRVGNHDTPYKISTGSLDYFSDEAGDYNATAGMVDRRAGNAIAYISPTFGGLHIAAAIVPGEAPGTDGDDLHDGISIAAMYSAGGLYAAIAYEDVEDLGAAPETMWRAGVGYDAGAFRVAAVYEDRSDPDSESFFINAGFKFGNNEVKALYAKTDGGSDPDSFGIGLDHHFSKKTKGYIQYVDSERQIQNYGVEEANAFSVGLVTSF
ncbi:MAG: porin [Chromatiales bacterium]|nr:porin [Chromatiales bacterium]